MKHSYGDALSTIRGVSRMNILASHGSSPFLKKELFASWSIKEMLLPLTNDEQLEVWKAVAEKFPSIKEGSGVVHTDAQIDAVKEYAAAIAADKLVEPRRLELWNFVNDTTEEIKRLIREWHAPLVVPKTAQNLEILAMNIGRFYAGMSKLVDLKPDLTTDDFKFCVELWHMAQPKFGQIVDLEKKLNAAERSSFFDDWFKEAFARVEVSHKLAASFALTEVPSDIEVKAPWKAWSLIVPDGLFAGAEFGATTRDPSEDGKEYPCDVARCWCFGTRWYAFVTAQGRLFEVPPNYKDSVAGQMVDSLICSVCLAMSNPEDFKKETRRGGSGKSTKNARSGPPELSQLRFLLSAPVSVDFRDEVKATLEGRPGSRGPLAVQFRVRGHWRRQRYGEGRSLQKTIWIQPFWKGPEESRVLLRQHKVDP